MTAVSLTRKKRKKGRKIEGPMITIIIRNTAKLHVEGIVNTLYTTYINSPVAGNRELNNLIVIVVVNLLLLLLNVIPKWLPVKKDFI